MGEPKVYTLSQLAKGVTDTINANDALRQVWVTGETVDVRVSGGHCYLELVEKDPATSRPVARMRANIWANVYSRIAAQFRAETGQEFKSDLKVMLGVTVCHHPVYGLALNVSAINSAYTMGDAQRRRREMIERLKAEGIIDMNRSLPWTAVPQRIAVISARGAAGYGDFVNQLYTNAYRLRFYSQLFPAVLQGDRTAPSIISALHDIADEIDRWDCVVIIRGGGATSDLASFDDYDLAANIAQFPIPVVIGIGHERDITLLDYVANMRVKTPTAAAEWLVQRGADALGRLQALAQAMLQSVTDRLSGNHRQLAYISGQLPAAAQGVVAASRSRLANMQLGLGAISDRRLRPQLARLDGIRQAICQAAAVAMAKNSQRLAADEDLIKALSPTATLKRGYSITRVDGHALVSASQARKGQTVVTTLADGEIVSTVL